MNLKTATLIALICWIAVALLSIWEFIDEERYRSYFLILRSFVGLASVISLVIFLFVLHSKQKGT